MVRALQNLIAWHLGGWKSERRELIDDVTTWEMATRENGADRLFSTVQNCHEYRLSSRNSNLEWNGGKRGKLVMTNKSGYRLLLYIHKYIKEARLKSHCSVKHEITLSFWQNYIICNIASVTLRVKVNRGRIFLGQWPGQIVSLNPRKIHGIFSPPH